MGHLPQLIEDLAIILITAGIATLIFKKIKQPMVLGYILAGFLMSPFITWLPNVGDTDSITVWADIGVIFLMFALGLEFSLPKLADVGSSAIITALTEMIFMIAAGYLCGMALGWSTMNCLFLGGMLAISSTTIIIKAFDDLGIRKEKFTNLVFGTLVVEDIVGIFMMVLLSTLAIGTTGASGSGSGFDAAEVAIQIGQMALYLVLWFVGGIILVPSFIKKIEKYLSDEILLIISIGLCLGMVVLANYIGFSSALGAFIAGSILAGTTKAERIEHLTKPVKDLFGAVFFVSVGMLVDPAMISEHIIPIVLITLATIIFKPIFSAVGVLLSGQPLKTAVKTGLSLSQVGEFSFIIASLGVTLGVTSDFLYPIIVSVSIVTTLLTPFFIKQSDNVYNFIVKIMPKKMINSVRSHTSSKQSTIEKDSVWKIFLQRQFRKIGILVVVVLAITEVFARYIQPIFVEKYDSQIAGFIMTAVAILIIAPFIANLFSQRKDRSFTILWFKARSNHLPLFALSMFSVIVATASIAYVVFRLEDIHARWIAFPALIVAVLISRSDWLMTRFIKLEVHFMTNLNERSLAEKKEKRDAKIAAGGRASMWLDERLYISSTRVLQSSIGPVERRVDFSVAHAFKKVYGLNVIKIIRKGKEINIPDDDVRIKVDDEVFFIGTKESINGFWDTCENRGGMIKVTAPITLHQYIDEQNDDDADNLMCFVAEVKRRSFLDGLTIKESGLIDNYGAVVLGVERDDLPILYPNNKFEFRGGDKIWLLGEERTGQKLAVSEII